MLLFILIHKTYFEESVYMMFYFEKYINYQLFQDLKLVLYEIYSQIMILQRLFSVRFVRGLMQHFHADRNFTERRALLLLQVGFPAGHR